MRLTREELTPDVLATLLEYSPETGKFRWFPRGEPAWDGLFANRPALIAINGSGYYHGTIACVSVQAHRVAWALHYGEWPNGLIDHINGNPADNRIENLRVVDTLENNRNTARNSRNTSGVPGVVWHSRDRKWMVMIRVGGDVRKFIGYFRDFDTAVAARKAAEREYGFHENFGRERIVSAA